MAKQKRRVKSGLLTSADLMKGFTSLAKTEDIWTLAPVHCIPLEEKDENYIKHCADWWEQVALKELPKKAARLQKSYNLAQGIINKSDYIYNPNNDVAAHLGVIGIKDNEQDLMTQFFPIIPNVIGVFMGEKLRRDNKVIVDAVDPESINEALKFKMDSVSSILEKDALAKKQFELMKMGLIPSENMAEEQMKMYEQEMQSAKELANVETRFKKFRTSAAQWGQHFIDKYTARNWFEEIDLELFADSLIADEAIIALNLHENDFTPEILQSQKTYVNISPTKTYYSEANGIVHIDFMSIPDIINAFRDRMDEHQVASLENYYNNKFSRDILLDSQNRSTDYWDTSKSYKQNSQTSPAIKENMSQEAIENFVKNAVGGGSLHTYTNNFDNPKVIRVTRVWWPSQRKIGKLTTIDEAGMPVTTQIDENYLITQKAIYNKSLLNEESAKTLIKGEHVEWKWVNEWRYVIKIGENRPFYTLDTSSDFQNIYIGGEPIKFQFKGDKNIWDARPPIEGRRFSNRNSMQSSLVDQMKPWQIMYNVVNNRVARVLPYDYGKVLVTNKSSIPRNSLEQQSGIEPLFEYLDSMRQNKISVHDDTIENMEGRTGRQIEPRVLDLSTVEQATFYLQMGIVLKQQAFEAIGVSQERLSNIQASQSATGVQQAVEGSVNQTEIRFDLFQNKFMQRVYQLILNAGQYYTSMSEEFNDTYVTKDLDKVIFSVLKTDLLMRDLLVIPVTTSQGKAMMQQLKQLVMQDNTMGMRFLEKAKTLVSVSTSEVFEGLEKAEAERIAEEQQKQQHEKELQESQQAFLDKQAKEAAAKEDERFYAKLQNELEKEQIRAMGFPGGQADSDANNVPDVLEYQKFQLQSDTANANIAMNQQKIAQTGMMNNQKMNLEREKMQLKREENATNLAIAQENKNSDELKFQQLRKDKKEQAKKKS